MSLTNSIAIAAIIVLVALDVHGSEPRKKVEVASVVESDIGGYVSNLDLGKLPSGAEIDVIWHLGNPSNATFVFSEFRASCSCISVEANDKDLKPGGEFTAKLVLKTPERSVSPKVHSQIYATPPGGSSTGVLLIKIQYELEGLLSLRERSAIIDLLDKEKVFTVSIPLVYSPPVAIENITVDVPASLSAIKTVAIKKEDMDNQAMLEISVDPKGVPPSGAFGLLHLEDRRLARKEILHCAIRFVSELTVFPSSVRFSQKDGLWQGNVVLRVAPSVKHLKEHDFEKAKLECLLGDFECDATCRHIGNGTFRVALKSSLNDLQVNDNGNEEKNVGKKEYNMPRKIAWVLKISDQVLVVETPVFFEQRLLD